MDKYIVKRQRADDARDDNASKRARDDEWGCAGDPRTIVVWNCNGLGVRLGKPIDRSNLLAFMSKHRPNVLCIGEVRAAAMINGSRRLRGQFAVTKTGSADKAAVERCVEDFAFKCSKIE
jgi:hypothetical protein